MEMNGYFILPKTTVLEPHHKIGHSLGRSYISAEIHLVDFTAPADWAVTRFVFDVSYNGCRQKLIPDRSSLIKAVLYSLIIKMHIYTYTSRIHIDTIIKTSEDFFKRYTSHFIERVVCERELETEQRLHHIDLPRPSGYSHVSFSFSWTARPLGALLSTASCL